MKLVTICVDILYLSMLALVINVWAGLALNLWPQLKQPLFFLGVGIMLTVGVRWFRPHFARARRRARR